MSLERDGPSAADTEHYRSALRFLNNRIDHERMASIPYRGQGFKLGRVRKLLDRLGAPERSLPIVHVAGTKGKGSVAALVAAALTRSGHRTGLFTSPHLQRVEERVAIDGRPCDPERFAELVHRAASVVEVMDRTEPMGPTFFEVVTAVALLCFAEAGCSAAVLEVGLGGRLDSTNVCRPRVAAITSISLDHTQQLGDTLAEIAREKAGIIKRGVPIVSGVIEPEPRNVIREVAAQQGARLVELARDFHYRYWPPRGLEQAAAAGVVYYESFAGRRRLLQRVPLALLGRHQAVNAAVALAVIEELGRQGWNIPEQAVCEAWGRLSWPARVEVVTRRPAVVIDAAHNVASAAALVETLEESFQVRRKVLVFAGTREKDVAGMLRVLLARFDDVVLTQYGEGPRAVPVEELQAMAASLAPGRPCHVCRDPAEAWRRARDLAAPEDLICVTGSFYLAGQIRVLALGSAHAPPYATR